MNNIKLTQYSHGAGCGCKISPADLSDILKSSVPAYNDKNLLVGNDKRDDAAVYDMGDGTAVISTTDFFMPIADDAYTFGRIAAANAISDIFAMGGNPFLAIAILGWPIDKLPTALAGKVMDGGRAICNEAGIVLAGGHSIDSPEPIFGLAVTGKVDIDKLKRNDTATPGCRLYLTKPLGVGILTTAQKRGKLKQEHASIAPEYMCKLNSVGMELAKMSGVKAMTDVTGFSLAGHLTEMCEGNNLSAEIEYEKIPKIDVLQEYIDQKCIPGGTYKNWKSYGSGIKLSNDRYKELICDPQTSGGLLIAVEEESENKIEKLLKEHNLEHENIGLLSERADSVVFVG